MSNVQGAMSNSRPMKDSGVEWIGEIPEEWEKQKAFRLFSIVGSGTTPKSIDEEKYTNGTVNWIQSGDIDKGIVSSCKTKISLTALEQYSALKIYTAPFIVIAMYGASIGNTGISSIDGCVNQACCVLSEPNAEFKFSFYSLMAAKGYLITRADGGGQPNISQEKIKALWIPLPNYKEQRRIADFLDRRCAEIDGVIEATKKTIEEYKALKQSIITEAVTKGVRGARPMKDSGIEWIGEIPEEWEIVRLKNLFDFGKGLPITKENLIESGIPVISYGQIHSKITTGVELQQHLYRYVDAAYVESNPQSLVHKGDFIFADTSEDLDGCGNAVYIDNELTLFAGYHTIVFSSKGEKNNKFLAYLFRTDAWRSQIRSKVSGVKVLSISRRILADATVVIPNIDDREAIVAYLDDKCKEINRIIERKQELLTEFEMYKKSVIYEYVTGKREGAIDAT